MDDLLRFCQTERQREIIQAVIDHGGSAGAAAHLGTGLRHIQRIVASVKGYAAMRDPSLHDYTKQLPDGYKLRGISALHDAKGNVVLQWTKSYRDVERQKEIMQEVIDSLREEIPQTEPIPPPEQTYTNLANLYPITDYHLGMMAWREEAGEDWDLKIAEDLLLNWFSAAIRMAPDAKLGIFAQMGDFLHFDGLEAVTPTNRNILDSDTRFQKMVRVAIRVIRQIITMLLQKHQKVHVIMADANHDPASSAWLREFLHAFYDNEPRVFVDNSADTYYCIEFGNTALFFHHGHKRKPKDVDDVFVAKYREIFGRTKYCYAHMGHMHHIESKETNLMLVEQHRTLAAKDAYASKGGWMAGRDAKVITYSSLHGEVGRITITPEMVR